MEAITCERYQRNLRLLTYEVERIQSAEADTVAGINFYLEHISATRSNLVEIQHQLLHLCDLEAKTDRELEDNELDEVIELHKMTKLFDKLDRKAINFKSKLTQEDLRPAAGAPSVSANIKLPRAELPSFEGDLIKWEQFFDLFKAAVHNNRTLTPAQKLAYLKGCLKGQAGDILSSLQILDENYEPAIELLKNRYESPRRVVFSIIEQLHNLPVIKSSSSNALLKLVDTFRQHKLQLSKFEVLYADNNPYLSFLLLQKLDAVTKHQWHMSLGDDYKQLPDLEAIFAFLEKAASSHIMSSNPVSIKKPSAPKTTIKPDARSHQSFTAVAASAPTRRPHISTRTGIEVHCPHCKANHPLSRCHRYINLTIPERADVVQNLNLCKNCLSANHKEDLCPSSSCRMCSQRHHTSLCTSQHAPVTGSTTSCPSFTCHAIDFSLLPTASVYVRSAKGELIPARCLLDSGSQSHFITSSMATRLGLPVRNCTTDVFGIAACSTRAQGQLAIEFISRLESNHSYQVTVNILPRLTQHIPSIRLSPSLLKAYDSLSLADPYFHHPGPIDIILGVEIWSAILRPHILKHLGPFSAFDTTLGWILMGSTDGEKAPSQFSSHLVSLGDLASSSESSAPNSAMNQLIPQFWDIPSEQLSPDVFRNNPCIEHFESTYKRLASDKFSLALPFKQTSQALGQSRHVSLAEFLSLGRRFRRDPALREAYIAFMREHHHLDHMSKIEENISNISPTTSCYLSHHAVFRSHDPSRKIRVVFNCSGPTSNKISLNDLLMTGPPLQNDLRNLLTSFRLYPIAVSADLVKFYRCIELNDSSRQFLRVFWRENETDPLEVFTLNTLVFGATSSPFQAIYTLKKLAELEKDNSNDSVLQSLNDHIYIDDLLLGFTNLTEAADTLSGLQSLLKRGGFSLSKWASNKAELLERLRVDPEDIKTSSPTAEKPELTFGVNWDPAKDVCSNLLRVDGRLQQGPFHYTKHHSISLYHRRVTCVYIKHLHIVNYRAGLHQVLSFLRQVFFLSRAKSLITKTIRECTIRARFNAKPMRQITAPLPKARFTPARPFLSTGLDCAGSFLLTEMIGRMRISHKSYEALFVCMATKAVHLELVSNLTSEAFLAAPKRFISCRGAPADLYCNRGTIFQGAHKELKAVQNNLFRVEDTSIDSLVSQGVRWHFLPPYNPHAGGLWERAVQSMKFHLRRVAAKTPFTFESLTTLLAQCEVILNSRPLTLMSDHPDCLEVLAPFHFLIGSTAATCPTPDYRQLSESRPNQWQKIDSYTHIWKRWRDEFAVLMN